MGAGVTNVSVFAGGMLVGLKSLPIGGIDLTDDIASAFGTRRAEAERMKCFYGSATTSPRDNHDMIDVNPVASAEEGVEAVRITRAQLIAVIRQRLEHLMGEIASALKELGFSGPFGRQVVLTGGGSELKGIADYAQGVLGRAVRVGRPKLPGLPMRMPARPSPPWPASRSSPRPRSWTCAASARCGKTRRNPRAATSSHA
jgi:cell division protein FtsA